MKSSDGEIGSDHECKVTQSPGQEVNLAGRGQSSFDLSNRNNYQLLLRKIYIICLSRKIQPPFLKPGDEVAIVSPAFAIDEGKIESSVKVLESWGLKVHVGKNVLKKDGPFAGTDKERLSDFQKATDNKKIKAVFCSRGGYGLLQDH